MVSFALLPVVLEDLGMLRSAVSSFRTSGFVMT